MDYIEKARVLGESLKNTPQVQKLKEAEEEIKKDTEAYEAFQEYQKKERGIAASQMFSKVVSEKESLALIDLRMRLMKKYPAIRNFFNVQKEFEQVMAMVNLTLTTTIYGMPKAEQLPFPDELKNMAQQILDNVSGGKEMPQMELPENFELPEGLNLSNFMKKQ